MSSMWKSGVITTTNSTSSSTGSYAEYIENLRPSSIHTVIPPKLTTEVLPVSFAKAMPSPLCIAVSIGYTFSLISLRTLIVLGISMSFAKFTLISIRVFFSALSPIFLIFFNFSSFILIKLLLLIRTPRTQL